MFNQNAHNKRIDNLKILPAVIARYIPEELRRHIVMKRQIVRSELEYIQAIFDCSNNKLGMYENAQSLLRNLLAYKQFPLSRKMFPIEMGKYHHILPDVYHNFKEEFLFCKQDYLFYLQSCVYSELRAVSGDEMPVEVIDYMKKHETRLSGCYEFVKYDHEIFEKIREQFMYATTLQPIVFTPETVVEKVTITRSTTCSFYKEKNYIEVFDGLISEYPWIFLPNNETKDKRAAVVVRVFNDLCDEYVMESELFNAINFKNPGRIPLKCEDVDEGFLKTIDYKYVLETFQDEIAYIDFARWPVMHTDHVAVPIATPTGGHCVRATDALLEVINLSIRALKVFQKIKRNTWHMVPKFVALLEKYFPPNIKYRYFITLPLIKKMHDEMNDFWRQFKDKPAKDVRDVGPNGFTVEDLKKELKYLGYTDIFPEIITSTEVRLVYSTCVKARKSQLTTYDMFRAVEMSVGTVVLNRFPRLHEFFFRQKGCIHTAPIPCALCIKDFKAAEARIEAEKQAEQAAISSAVTATSDEVIEEKCQKKPESESVRSEARNTANPGTTELKNEESAEYLGPNPVSSDTHLYEKCPETPNTAREEVIDGVTELKRIDEPVITEAPSTEMIMPGAFEIPIESSPEHQLLPIPTISEGDSEANPALAEGRICQKCMETSNDAREEVMETYKKMMILEKTLKEKDAELERLRIFEQKSNMSDEKEKKMKDLEKEAEEWKMKHLKILEENVKMGNMLKNAGNLKALESQLEELKEQLSTTRSELKQKAQRCEKLEKTIKEKDEEIHDLTETEKSEKQATEDYRVTVNRLLHQLKDKDKEIVERKKANEKSEASNAEGIKELHKSFSKFKDIASQGAELFKEKVSMIEELELKNSKITKEKNEEIEKLKKQQELLAKENKKEIEQLKRNASKTAEEVMKLTAEIAEKEAAQDRLKDFNKELLEKLRKVDFSLQIISKKHDDLRTEITEQNGIIEQLKRNASKSADEIMKLNTNITEKKAAENRLKQSNKELHEKIRKANSNLREITEKHSLLEAKITDKNRIIQELQKFAEKQDSEQEKAKKKLEAEISTIRGALDRISPPEPEEKPECLICFYEMKSDQKTLKCEHCRKVVHLECASKWHKNHRSCAHCRREQLDPNEFPSLQ